MKQLLYKKKWYLKRRAAHWILSQIAANSVSSITRGITLEKRGDRYDFNESNATSTYFYMYPVVELKKLSKKTPDYSIAILNNAKDLLKSNGHIQITQSNQKDIYDVAFCATDAGRIAYEDEYYKSEENERIHQGITRVSNWLTPILTLIIAAIALYVSCNQDNSKRIINTTTTAASPK